MTTCYGQSHPKDVNIGIGSSKVKEINKLISTYAEYGDFNGAILVAEEGGHYGYGWSIKNKPLGNSNDQIQTIGQTAKLNKRFCLLLIVDSLGKTDHK
jgi:hypothetical protein